MCPMEQSRCQNHADAPHSLEGPVVPVSVGPEPKTFYIHESLLAQAPFFQAALDKEWREGQQRFVSLPDDDPDVFYRYTQWLYRGKIASRTRDNQTNHSLLASLYVLAEKLLHREFQNRAIDAIVEATRAFKKEDGSVGRVFPGAKSIDIIYRGTLAGSAARRLMVDMYVGHAPKEFFDASDFNHDFLMDFAKAMADTRPKPTGGNLRFEEINADVLCTYHQHDEAETCGSRKG